ncbi:MAG: hypothetical protein H7255_00355 [Ramlibacter sp.]|nr:hypothetical protein [Ramlibacter sp.]
MRRPNHDIVNVAEINPHAPRPYTFTEAALCMRDSIRAAGYRSELYVNRTDIEHRTIVLGALPPNLSAVDNVGARKAVVYNFEQLGSESILLGNDYVPWLRKWLVADYHSRNVEWLRTHHPDSIPAMELPIVPSPVIAFRPELVIEREFDVLFFGSPTPRREVILQGLREAGLSVEVVAGAFASELTPAIKRARIVLHVHFYGTGLFPVARVLQPVVQGVPIVCETSIQSALSDWSGSGIVFAPYEGLVQACRDLLASADERARRAMACQAFAAAIDFRTPFESLLRAWDDVPGAMPPTPIALPPPTASPSMATAVATQSPNTTMRRSIKDDDRPLSNEEIEAILQDESHDLPPEAHIAPPPLKIAERTPGKGPYGVLVVWLLVLFSAYTIWMTMR